MKALLALVAAALSASPALAIDSSLQLQITLPGAAQQDVTSYSCEGMDAPVEVQYINADPLFLAFVPIEGEKRLFVNVLSASGAKYASGPYVWWTKGDSAELTDLTAAKGVKPIACTAESLTP